MSLTTLLQNLFVMTWQVQVLCREDDQRSAPIGPRSPHRLCIHIDSVVVQELGYLLDFNAVAKRTVMLGKWELSFHKALSSVEQNDLFIQTVNDPSFQSISQLFQFSLVARHQGLAVE